MPEFNSAFNILTGAQVYQDYKSTLESLQQHQDEKIVKEAKAIIALLTSNESKEHWQGLKELKELHNNYKDTGVLPEAAKADLDKLSDYDNRYFYFAPKSGGVHDPGPLGGRYFHVGTGRQLLAKKDDFNDIAEYFSAGLLRARDPNIAPEIILLKPPSPLGNDVPPYLGSIYFENYEDLFKDIHITYYQLTLAKSLHKNLADLNIDKDTTTLRLQVSDPHDFNKDSIIEKLESSAVKLANIIAATQEEIEIDSDNNATSKKLQKQLDQLKAEHEKLTVQINELSHMSVDGTPENHLLLQEKANAALDILDRSEKPIKNYIDEREARIPQDRGRMLGTKQWLGLKEGKIFRKSILHKNKDGEPQYQDAERNIVLSLAIGDFDAHYGNEGVITANGKKRIVRIDLGAALKGMHFFTRDEKGKLVPEDIHMHSRSLLRHVPGDPSNHIREKPRKTKISMDFAKELDGTADWLASPETKQTITKLLKDISKHYPLEKIKGFAKHVGMDEKEVDAYTEEKKGALIEKLDNHMRYMLTDARVTALKKLSLEIKVSLCFKKTGPFRFQLNPEKEEDFKKLVLENAEYFEKGQFHFRTKEQKGPALLRVILSPIYHLQLSSLVGEHAKKVLQHDRASHHIDHSNIMLVQMRNALFRQYGNASSDEEKTILVDALNAINVYHNKKDGLTKPENVKDLLDIIQKLSEKAKAHEKIPAIFNLFHGTTTSSTLDHIAADLEKVQNAAKQRRVLSTTTASSESKIDNDKRKEEGPPLVPPLVH